MAKAIKHTVDGAVGERKSPRTYTHAIVGMRDWDREEKSAIKNAKYVIEQNWAYNVRTAAAKVGDIAGTFRTGENYYHKDSISIDAAKAFFAEYGTDMALAVAKKTAEALAEVGKARAAASELPVVLQWSMSEGNARKAINTWVKYGWMSVEVRKVVRHG